MAKSFKEDLLVICTKEKSYPVAYRKSKSCDRLHRRIFKWRLIQVHFPWNGRYDVIKKKKRIEKKGMKRKEKRAK